MLDTAHSWMAQINIRIDNLAISPLAGAIQVATP
jgi:hypothetical protein